MLIRSEKIGDIPAIHTVNIRAFGQPAEAELVARIRKDCGFDPKLSLVAVIETDNDVWGATCQDAASDGRVVGHLLLSPIHVETDGGAIVPALALAPMAVLPEYQRQGIGSQLVRAAFDAARNAGCRIIVVLGHASYYPRFGFEPASKYGVRSPFDVPDEAFLLIGLTPDALTGIHGVVRYPSVFNGV